MMPAQSRIDAGIWSVPGHSLVIEYHRPVLNGILTHVIHGFDEYLDGGYEVGGVLFGIRDGDVVRVQGFRPLDIQPPRPSFVLSEADGKTLTALLREAARDPMLDGLEPVGWYHSHTRSDVFLSEGDTEIYDRYFPEPWQIALVLHPSLLEPVRAGFFFRESDGFIQTSQSYLEFAIDAPVDRPEYRKPPPWGGSGQSGMEEPPPLIPLLDAAEMVLPGEAQEPSFWQRTGRWIFLWASAALFVAAAANFALPSGPEPQLGLKLAPTERELVIRWDPAGPGWEGIDEATLTIQDGSERVQLKIENRPGQNPYHRYKPVSPRVDVRLIGKRSWGRVRADAATYLRHPDLGKPTPELVAARQQQAEATRVVQELRTELTGQLKESEKLESAMEQIRQRRAALEEARKQAAAKPLNLPPPRRTVAAPKDLPNAPEIALRGNVAPPQVAPADLGLRPPVDPPKPSPLTPSAPAARPAVVPAPIAPRPTPAAAAVTGPASGRIIWSGELGRDAVLTVMGNKSSRGSINAELPGVAVRVAAYPALLTADGLKVLTGNPKYATAPRVEPPGANNGYQKTQYLYDPKAMRDLIVEQMPGPQDYKKMVLRATGRKLSFIVIEWQVATP